MRANDSPLNRSFLFSYRTTPSKIHAMITSDTAQQFYCQLVLNGNPGWSGSNYHHEKLAVLMLWVLALWPIFKTFKYSWKQMQLCTTYLHNAVANTVSSHSKPWKKKKRHTCCKHSKPKFYNTKQSSEILISLSSDIEKSSSYKN